MKTIKFKLKDESEFVPDQAIIKDNMPNADDPIIVGDNKKGVNYACGNCGKILAKNATEGRLSELMHVVNVVIQCQKCNCYNQLE
jgi:hypothetical protein